MIVGYVMYRVKKTKTNVLYPVGFVILYNIDSRYWYDHDL